MTVFVDEALELRLAVDELTLPTFVKVSQEVDGRERVTRVEHPPLLTQLETSIRETIASREGTGASQKHARGLLDPDALYQFTLISATVRDWCRMAGAEVRRNPADALRGWHATVLAQDIPRPWYTAQLKRWARTIEAVVEPRRPLENTSPCPVCLNTEWRSDQDNGGVFPVHVTYAPHSTNLLSTVRATCRACGAHWEGEQGSRALRYEQDTVDAIFEAIHGEWKPELRTFKDGTPLHVAAAILRRKRFPVCEEHALGRPENCTGWAVNDDKETVPCTAAETEGAE